MKQFKQILNEAGKVYKRGQDPDLKRQAELTDREYMGGYLGVGHDTLESEKVREAVRKAFGIDPTSTVKPTELWAAGPHVDHSKGERVGNVNIRSLKDQHDTSIHQDLYPEFEGIKMKPYIGGRIDHAKRKISMSAVGPRKYFSSGSIDSIVKSLKERHPEYDIIDMIDESVLERVKKVIAEAFGKRLIDETI